MSLAARACAIAKEAAPAKKLRRDGLMSLRDQACQAKSDAGRPMESPSPLRITQT